MVIAVILVLLFIILMVATGLIVFFAIRHARKANRLYQNFAQQHNYTFDKAMVKSSSYRDYSKNKVSFAASLPMNGKYIDNYANYESFPFGRGTEKCVSYVIEGNYKAESFCTFTYSFNSQVTDGLNGGVYSVIGLRTSKTPVSLPTQTVYDNGFLYCYKEGNLNVDEIHPTLETLLSLVN